MGTAKFWYYPDPDGTLEEIDLGTQYITDLDDQPDPLAYSSESADGTLQRTLVRDRLRVRIFFERFASASLERSLMSMRAHLEKGRPVGFARDSAQAWAGFTYVGPSRGTTSVTTRGLVFNYNSSALLSAGSPVVLQGMNQSELLTATQSGYTFTFASGTRYTYDSDSPCLLRHRDFYPVLRLPQDQIGRKIVTTDKRLTYTLDITLVEDLGSTFLLQTQAEAPLMGTTSSGGKISLDNLVSRQQQLLNQVTSDASGAGLPRGLP